MMILICVPIVYIVIVSLMLTNSRKDVIRIDNKIEFLLHQILKNQKNIQSDLTKIKIKLDSVQDHLKIIK